MAQRTLIVLEDDVDGSKADETVYFAIDGATYEIDLSSDHADQLRKAFGPYLGAARQTGGRAARGRARKKSSSSGGDIDTRAVRSWAQSNNVPVSARGRIAADVIERFHAAGH